LRFAFRLYGHRIIKLIGDFFETHYLIDDFYTKIMGKAVRPCAMHKDLSFVQYHPQKSLDMPIERFFASFLLRAKGKAGSFGD
jgi:hypothetical protein